MKVYNQLLQKIKNELTKEEVESNEYQISLYDLYSLVNDEYKELRSITQNKKNFTSKELFRRSPYYSVRFSCSEKENSILIWVEEMGKVFWIKKENDSNELFTEKFKRTPDKYINKFIKKYYNEIMEKFSILEKYSELIEFANKIHLFKICYDNCIYKIIIDEYGNVDLKIKLDDEIKHKEICTRQYYGKDTIMKILEDSKYEIAKKIRINAYELDNSIVEVINKRRENNNKKLVK